MHRRMGDVWKPDKAVSRFVIKACFTILEYHWETFAIDNYSKMMISKTTCIVITGYYGSLRGEEIGKADLGGMRKYWNEAMNYRDYSDVPSELRKYWRQTMMEEDYRHIPLILAGTFKGEEGVKLFIQPLAARTKDGRDLSKWYIRYIHSLQEVGITKGPLF